MKSILPGRNFVKIEILSEPDRKSGKQFLRASYNCSMDSNCESSRKKVIGKPYSGKSNVRFDEGELEIGVATTSVPYSTNTFLSPRDAGL